LFNLTPVAGRPPGVSKDSPLPEKQPEK
jgi:hypothetical protein